MDYKKNFKNTKVVIPYEGKDWEFKLDLDKSIKEENIVVVEEEFIRERLEMYRALTNDSYSYYDLQEILVKEYEGNIIAMIPILIRVNIIKSKVSISIGELLIANMTNESIVYADEKLLKSPSDLYRSISLKNISIVQDVENNSKNYKLNIEELDEKICELIEGKKYELSNLCSVHERSLSFGRIMKSVLMDDFVKIDDKFNNYINEVENKNKALIQEELSKNSADSEGIETTIIPISHKDTDVVLFIFRYIDDKSNKLIEFGRIYLIENIIYIIKNHGDLLKVKKIIPNKEILDLMVVTQNELDNMNTVSNHPIDYSGTKFENNSFMKNHSIKDPLSHLINLIEPINSVVDKIYQYHPLLKTLIDLQVEETRNIIKKHKDNYPTNFQEQLLNLMVLESFCSYEHTDNVEDIIKIKKNRLDIINRLPYSDEEKVSVLFYVKVVTALNKIRSEHGEDLIQKIYYEAVGEPMSYYMYKYLNKYQDKDLDDMEFMEVLRVADRAVKRVEKTNFCCPVLNNIIKE